MARSLQVITPNNDPINSTAECKAHLRIEITDDDTYIAALALAAKQTIESYCNIFILHTVCKQWCDTWVDTKRLYHGSVKNRKIVNGADYLSVTDIQYYDSDNALQSWASSEYIVDSVSMPARIGLSPDSAGYPNIANRLNAIIVNYTVGATEEDDDYPNIPEALKQAGLILVGQWYENRQEAVVGRSVGIIPLTARYLMNPYRVQTLGMGTSVVG